MPALPGTHLVLIHAHLAFASFEARFDASTCLDDPRQFFKRRLLERCLRPTGWREVIMNWLRVFGNAEASRLGQGVWPQLHARAVPSEKWWDSMAAYGAGMCVLAVFFDPYAPDALTPPVSVFSHNCKRFERFTKLATSSI